MLHIYPNIKGEINICILEIKFLGIKLIQGQPNWYKDNQTDTSHTRTTWAIFWACMVTPAIFNACGEPFHPYPSSCLEAAETIPANHRMILYVASIVLYLHGSSVDWGVLILPVKNRIFIINYCHRFR